MPWPLCAVSPAVLLAWSLQLLHRLRVGAKAGANGPLPLLVRRWSRSPSRRNCHLLRAGSAFRTDEPARVLPRAAEHFVAEWRSVSGQKRHEIQRSLLRLSERIKRSAGRPDFLHQFRMLLFRGGDETPLETLEASQQIRTQPARHGRTQRRAFFGDSVTESIELFAEKLARSRELVDDARWKFCPRDASLHSMRVAEIVGDKLEARESLFDVRLDDRARPSRKDQWSRNAQCLRNGGDLCEVSDLRRSADIGCRRKNRSLDHWAQQHVWSHFL